MQGIINLLSLISSALFILFIPGFFISYIFFDKNEIDLLERIALSFALSISIIPLIAFYVNLTGIKINKISVSIEILTIIFITAIILFFKKDKLTSKKSALSQKQKDSINSPPSMQQFAIETKTSLQISNKIIKLLTQKLNITHQDIKILGQSASETFNIWLTVYLILLLLETIKEGSVSNFFNVNIILGLILISGIFSVLLNTNKKQDNPQTNFKFTKKYTFYLIIMASGGGILVYYKIQEIGKISIFIAFLTSVLILFLSYLILTEETTE